MNTIRANITTKTPSFGALRQQDLLPTLCKSLTLERAPYLGYDIATLNKESEKYCFDIIRTLDKLGKTVSEAIISKLDPNYSLIQRYPLSQLGTEESIEHADNMVQYMEYSYNHIVNEFGE